MRFIDKLFTANCLNRPALLGVFVMALATFSSNTFAQDDEGFVFDHFQTGFALEGMHAEIECESCHALLKPKTGDCCYFALMAQSHVHRSRKTNLVVLDRDHTLNMGQAITNKPALLAIQSQCPYLFSSNVRCLIYY